MAPSPKVVDYVTVLVGGAVVCAFVFAVANNYRTPPAASIQQQALMQSAPSSSSAASSLRAGSLKAKKSSKTQPNIIFIMADDLGWNGIGYEDWSSSKFSDRYALEALAPTLTTLASQGIAFTNYYSQEVCTPSRASFLTGRYPLSLGMQYGVVEPYVPWGLNLSETTLAEVLSENGYDTHAIGKWHLGHHTERYLPTARGFDTYTGYLTGDNYYFSKLNPTYDSYTDFTASNATCYGTDSNTSAYSTYSTEYYRDLAVDIIDYYGSGASSNPFFLYLAFQAVHNPFYDPSLTKTYKQETFSHVDNTTLVRSILNDDMLGTKTQLYGLTLHVFDQAVADIVDRLNEYDMFDNTYLMFASDNGGCLYNGGRSAPLRGSKATLFEGGTKVDAFVYSPTLLAEASGNSYENLVHVSDWFPTILDMTGASYTPAAGYSLDGYSHFKAIAHLGSDDYEAKVPREYMLYNAYTHVLDADLTYDFNIYENGIFAIRNSQYKLIHAYNGTVLDTVVSDDNVLDDDDSVSTISDCKQAQAYEGTYQMMLFDLLADPYEQNNLYDSTDEDVILARNQLYTEYMKLNQTAVSSYFLYAYDNTNGVDLDAAETIWTTKGANIGPYHVVDYGVSSAVIEEKSYPVYCGSVSAYTD